MIFDLVFGLLFGEKVIMVSEVRSTNKPATKHANSMSAVERIRNTEREMANANKTKYEPPKVEVKEEENKTFTQEEIGEIVSRMGKDVTARLTPYGNVIVQHKDATKTLFAFYKRADGYLIRRRLGYDNPYGSGNVLNGGHTFDTLNDALNYFEEYREKYPNSLL